MSLKLVVVLAAVCVALGDQTDTRVGRSPSVLTGHHTSHGHHGSRHTSLGHHGGHHTNHGQHSNHHTSLGHHGGHHTSLRHHGGHHTNHGHHTTHHGNHATYGHQTAHGHGRGHRHEAPHTHPEPADPSCAENTTKSWCLEDAEYPTEEIQHTATHFHNYLWSLYADVVDLNTVVSVERPNSLDEETYLCPSQTAYVKPLRAINTEGKWRTIVNNIDVYHDTLTQTTRIEECLTSGASCPLVPECYESKCLQKSIHHRFLIYDPLDHYFPFAVETFKLPASCACLLGAYTITE